MKKQLLAIFLCFPLLTFAQNQKSIFQADDIPAMEQKSFAKRLKTLSPNVGEDYDLKYHRCEWAINPAVSYIYGNITSYLKPTVAGFNKIEFNLSAELTVDSIKFHNTNTSFNQTSNDVLEINLPTVIPINTLDSVTVFYHGVPPHNDTSSFFRTAHNNSPIIWTLSEPFGAKDWWPCKQSLNDKIDAIDIFVTTPSANKVASNGLLLSEITNGGNTTFHWKSTYPIATYLIGIAITDYAVYSDFIPLQNGDSLECLNYVYPENFDKAKTETADIINIIKLFDSLTIQYPFANEKYGHAQFSWGGGMEHQTMSFMVDFSFPLMAHEAAHQWFGNHITCNSWQNIWLNEGFATYFEGLATERYQPELWSKWKETKVESVTSLPGGSVLCGDTTSAKRIFDARLTYNKGAYLLHMLRWKLGDVLFFQAIKNYLNDPLLAGAYANTESLITHFETTSNQNLSTFFEQWYYQQGHPSYQLNWTQTDSEVTLTLKQTQSHNSVSFFEMPIEIQFIGPTKDTTIIFNHSFSGESFTATINFPIIQAKIDPKLWILSAENTVTETPPKDKFVTLYPNPTKKDLNILSLNNGNPVQYFEITDAAGKIVYQSERIYGLQKVINISTASFSKGSYLVKLVLKSNVVYKSFVKL